MSSHIRNTLLRCLSNSAKFQNSRLFATIAKKNVEPITNILLKNVKS